MMQNALHIKIDEYAIGREPMITLDLFGCLGVSAIIYDNSDNLLEPDHIDKIGLGHFLPRDAISSSRNKMRRFFEDLLGSAQNNPQRVTLYFGGAGHGDSVFILNEAKQLAAEFGFTVMGETVGGPAPNTGKDMWIDESGRTFIGIKETNYKPDYRYTHTEEVTYENPIFVQARNAPPVRNYTPGTRSFLLQQEGWNHNNPDKPISDIDAQLLTALAQLIEQKGPSRE